MYIACYQLISVFSSQRLTHFKLNRLSPYYILEELNFSFRYVRLSDLNIHVRREKWLNYLQTVTVETALCGLRSGSTPLTNYPFRGSPTKKG